MKKFILLLLVLLLMPVSAEAAEEEYNEYIESYDLSFFEESLGKDAYQLLEELGVADFDYQNLSDLSFRQFADILLRLMREKVKAPAGGAGAVLLYILLSALFRSFQGDTDSGELFSTVSALVIATVLIVRISPSLSLAAGCIQTTADFIYAFVPAFCAIVAAGGGITTGFSANAMLLMLSQGLSVLAAQIFLPLINCFLSIGICAGLRSELQLSRLLSGMKRILTTAISFIAGAFVSILSLKTTVGARADYLGIRSVRFMINSVVPVIGGTLSEGLLSIQGYSSLLKSSVGIVGILGVVLVFLPSVAEILMWRLTLSICLIVCDVFEDKSVTAVLSAFRDTMLLISVVTVVAVMTTVISIGILIAARTA